MSRDDAIIGISDHGGWAVFVTVAGDGSLLDRRRVELVSDDLPKIPHHSEGQRLPIDQAVAWWSASESRRNATRNLLLTPSR